MSDQHFTKYGDTLGAIFNLGCVLRSLPDSSEKHEALSYYSTIYSFYASDQPSETPSVFWRKVEKAWEEAFPVITFGLVFVLPWVAGFWLFLDTVFGW